ncbi:MAG: hypothetical protein KAR13_18580, partial [Desulfobulbaceae bacterium]|nr:hypothetical protein [Desulfobulbaceae bacterium]
MKKEILRFVFIVLAVSIVWISDVGAATINAASCSQSDVQAAINSATTGDSVIVPSGNCTWSSTVTISSDKKITLQGAGIDSTIINRSPSGTAINLSQSGSRVTGFTFNEGSVQTGGDGWRVDHCMFYSPSSCGIAVMARGTNSHPSGLVDHCEFYNTRASVIGSAAMLREGDQQHMVWTNNLDLGTNNNALYVENCNLEFDVFCNAIDANYGGAYVFRFNHIKGAYIECHSVQGLNRGTRRWEIYG